MIENTQRSKSRGRSFKHLLMFAMSLALGGAAVFYSRQYIEQQVSYYKGQLDKTETMVEIIVPNRAMSRGEIIIADDIGIREIPEKYADTHTVNAANYEIALGQRLDFDIDQGKPLLWAHLEGGVTPTFSGKIADGLRAMTVRVDEINSISGFLQPKDKVDLLLSYGSGDKHQIFPLIQRLDIIATGVQTLVDKASDGIPRSFSTITVHVTPTDGQKITLAQQVGKLTALLRNPEDESDLSDLVYDVNDLLNIEEVLPPPPPPRRKRKIPVAKTEPAIEYIIGGRS